VPCYLGGMSRGLLGKNSDIQCRQKRGECLKEADTIILLGMLFITLINVLRPGLTLVRITRNSCDDFRELSSRYDQPHKIRRNT